jgi:alcohol dehydrogenase class IV
MASPALNYEFFAPPQIVFGWGRRSEIARLARPLGRRALLVTGSRQLESHGLIDELEARLAAESISPVRLGTISHEPLVEDVDRFTESLLHHNAPHDGDFLLAIGGGSAIDLAKAVAAMATNRNSPTVRDYLEGVGSGLKLEQPPLPLLAMPTTAGTGSEATKNAVISHKTPPFKKSLRSDLLVPRAVLVDPELAASLPAQTTAYTGMDAITQLIESYISCRAKPIPQALCAQGLPLAMNSIVEAVHDGGSRRAREAMAHAALLSGMALANSGLGMAHGVAAALGVICGVPHGLACAVMLPATLRTNRIVSLGDLATLARHASGNAIGDDAAAADWLIEQVESICTQIGIPRTLSEIGVERQHVPALVAASRGNSMSGNPQPISDERLQAVLEAMR